MVTGYFSYEQSQTPSGMVCQGSERTLPEGAGTQRVAAGKESWN
jgi:hypothetical protein